MATLFDSIESKTGTASIQMRPYQHDAVEAVMNGFNTYRKQILSVSTGGGKTLIFSWLAQKFLPGKTLILAHRDELIQQAKSKVKFSTGIEADIEKADSYADLDSPVVIGSIQSLMREKRLGRWPEDHFDFIVVDECHHVLADSYQRVLQHFDKETKVLGATATVSRGDRRNLGEYFENIAYEIGLVDLIKQKYLCPLTIKTVPLKIDVSGVQSVAGDLDAAQLGGALEPYLKQAAEAIRDHASFRKTLVFLPLIATSVRFVEICKSVGLAAEHIDGTSPDRKDILRRFSEHKIDLLSNAMLVTEGYDEPSVDCIVVMRPTKIQPLYQQMVGRGTRIWPTKENCLLLDFLWMHERHNLIRPSHLIASSDEVSKAMTGLTETPGGGEPEEHDIIELESQARAQREEKLRRELAKQTSRKSKVMDAMEYCLSIQNVDLAEFEPTMKWQSLPVTDGQVRFLTQMGIDAASVGGRGQASAIIDSIIKRRSMNLATPKQVEYLRQYGHQTPSTATFKEASAFLSEAFKKNKGRSKSPLSEGRK